MSKEPTWLSTAVVLAIHERLVAEHGGAEGIRNQGSLEAALAAPRNRYLYERAGVFQLAAAYAHALTRNHPFIDGNKRVALTMAGVFLELNGHRLTAPERDAVTVTIALSGRKLDEAAFAAWLRTSSIRIPKGGSRRPATRIRRRNSGKKR